MRQPGQDRINSRQQALTQLIRQRGFATIEAMAETFGVSAQTIRRDVIHLSLDEPAGALSRRRRPADRAATAWPTPTAGCATLTRSAASPPSSPSRFPTGRPCSSISGPPRRPSARPFSGNRSLRVITNHISVISMLLRAHRLRDHAARAAWSATATGRSPARRRPSSCAASASSSGSSASVPSTPTAICSTTITATSRSRGPPWKSRRRKFFVADSSKFSGDAMVQLAHMSEIDALFTDAPPPEKPGTESCRQRRRAVRRGAAGRQGLKLAYGAK